MVGRTKEEKFIMVAYEEAQRLGPDAELDRYSIGLQVGLKERSVDAAFKQFVQCNFVKKVGDVGFRLTDNGEALAQRLLSLK